MNVGHDTTLAELESALRVLDASDRDQWVRVGAALATLGDTGLQLWDAWSQSAGNYDARAVRDTWKSFHDSRSHWKAVFRYAREAGWRGAGGRISRPKRPNPIQTPPQTKKTVSAAFLTRLWLEAHPLTHPQAELARRYLDSRDLGAILEDLPSNLKFHPAMVYRDGNGRQSEQPALVARVQDAGGQLCALHRTFLSEQGDKLAKKALNPLPPGCAIRLYPHLPGHPLAIAEGIETALSVRIASDWLTTTGNVWSVISAGGMAKFTPPEHTARLEVYVDRDASQTGEKYARRLQKRLQIPARLLMPTELDGKSTDWLDVYATEGRL